MRVLLIQSMIVAYVGLLTGCAASAAAEDGVADHQHHADVAVPSPLKNGSFMAEKAVSTASSSSQPRVKKTTVNAAPSQPAPAQSVATPAATPAAATTQSAATSSAKTSDANIGSTGDATPNAAAPTSDSGSDGLISQ